MVARRRRANRKRAPRRLRGKRSGRKSVIPRGITTTQDQYCKVTETVAYQNVLPGVQSPNSFNLMEFSRARFMATGFQHYKAAKCTWQYVPLYNTYATELAASGDTIPYIYTSMNRTGDSNNPNTLAAFQAMGAKPVKFIKKHVVSYKPNWTTTGLPIRLEGSNGNYFDYQLGSRPCYDWIDTSPWLSTNNVGSPAQQTTGQVYPIVPPTLPTDVSVSSFTPLQPKSAAYSVMYHGHRAIFDQFLTAGDAAPIGRLILTVEWHFKSPIWQANITQNRN